MLERISQKCWGATFDLKISPGVYFPTRMSVIEVRDGELMLVSPIPMTEGVLDSIWELGEVRWIISPNDFHHMYVGEAAKKFPDAKVFGSPGAIRKQKSVEFDGSLEDGRPADLPDSVVLLDVAGIPAVNETVVWVPDDEALVVTDLVFQMPEPSTFWTKVVLSVMTDRSEGPNQSRAFRWFFVKDRPRYVESVESILAKRFDTLIPGHGEVMERGGHAGLANAVDWVFPDLPKKLTA